MSLNHVCARFLPALLLLVAVVVTSGCVVSSTQPLLRLEDSELIPEHLLGTWDIVELVGLDAQDRGYEFTMERNSDGSLRTLMSEPAGIVERHASLATVGDLTILSLAPDEGADRWAFASITFDETTQQLTVSFLRHAQVVQDIQLGRVAGDLYQFDQDDFARLTATPEQLRAYFVSHGEAAFSDRIAVLKKRPS